MPKRAVEPDLAHVVDGDNDDDNDDDNDNGDATAQSRRSILDGPPTTWG